MDVQFCLEALNQALKIAKPEIFNTDQGCQFTRNPFTGLLTENNIRISMGGHGGAYDNIFIKRLWRTIKYEEIYLPVSSRAFDWHEYQNGIEAYFALEQYFRFYNEECFHSSPDYKTLGKVYYSRVSSENKYIIETNSNEYLNEYFHLKLTQLQSKERSTLNII